jgi:arginine utilization protein RocB
MRIFNWLTHKETAPDTSKTLAVLEQAVDRLNQTTKKLDAYAEELRTEKSQRGKADER